MKKIKLRNSNKFTIVDDDDYIRLSNKLWRLNKSGYVIFSSKAEIIPMHRIINKTPKGFSTDHINGNRLDNRKVNLRTCTHTENMRNRNVRPKSSKTSIYKGVYKLKNAKKWTASIHINKKEKYLGVYVNEDDAAIAYNKAAEKYFGEFASYNIIKKRK